MHTVVCIHDMYMSCHMYACTLDFAPWFVLSSSSSSIKVSGRGVDTPHLAWVADQAVLWGKIILLNFIIYLFFYYIHICRMYINSTWCTQWRFSQNIKSSNPPRFVVGSFPRPLPRHTSTLNPPSATKNNNIIGWSMEQLTIGIYR